MDPVESHRHAPEAVLDGGDLDCGGGLLLLLRAQIDVLEPGALLEIRSTETSVDEDLPAWCRLTGNELVSWTRRGRERSFLVSRGPFRGSPAAAGVAPARAAGRPAGPTIRVPTFAASLPPPAPAPPIPPLSVMGVGSWPRPRWLVEALHARLEGRLPESEFEATADDAVRLAVDAQLRAGADVISDGEQRRDSYANFVGARLDNCQLIPLTDLLPLVDDPTKLESEFRSLDVPAAKVRHPAVFGPLGRSRPIAIHELMFLRSLSGKPAKVALPGPYLLTRVMWMECLSDRAYASREALAEDIVRVLREEVRFLLAAGAALVQLDEPVLTEVVYGRPAAGRSFMCGALSERGDAARELAFARDLVNRVVEGAPRERIALHVCRGNWTPDESAALKGDYRPLLGLFRSLDVGTFVLELATPRAGDPEVLRALPEECRVAVGVVNPKRPEVETPNEIGERARRAIRLFGRDRVLLVPDCGFATFADNPVASARAAEGKLRAMAEAARTLRGE